MIIFEENKEYTKEELHHLYASVQWESAQYPESLQKAIAGSDTAFSARQEDGTLVGLVNVLDDGAMTAYIHYLLVDPAVQGEGIGRRLMQLVLEKYKGYYRVLLLAYADKRRFYESCGLTAEANEVPMSCIHVNFEEEHS